MIVTRKPGEPGAWAEGDLDVGRFVLRLEKASIKVLSNTADGTLPKWASFDILIETPSGKRYRLEYEKRKEENHYNHKRESTHVPDKVLGFDYFVSECALCDTVVIIRWEEISRCPLAQIHNTKADDDFHDVPRKLTFVFPTQEFLEILGAS
jgi:hypothetical protein